MIKSHVFITFEPGAAYALPEISECNNGPLFERPFTEDEIFEEFKSRLESSHEDLFGYSGEDEDEDENGEEDDNSTLAEINKDSGWRSANRDQWWRDIYAKAYLLAGEFDWEKLVEEISFECPEDEEDIQNFAKERNIEMVSYSSREDLLKAIIDEKRTTEKFVIDLTISLAAQSREEAKNNEGGSTEDFKAACLERLKTMNSAGRSEIDFAATLLAISKGRL